MGKPETFRKFQARGNVPVSPSSEVRIGHVDYKQY